METIIIILLVLLAIAIAFLIKEVVKREKHINERQGYVNDLILIAKN